MAKPAFTALQEPAADIFNTMVKFLFTVIEKTADESLVSSTTFQDDNEMQLAVDASASYFGWIHTVYSSGTTPDYKQQLSLPAGARASNWTYLANPGGTLLSGITAGSAAGLSSGSLGTGANAVLDMWGLLVVSTTAGTAKVQWAQNTSDAGSTIVRAGSFFALLRYT